MRLSSSSALNNKSAQSKKTVASGLMKRFRENVSAKFSPVTNFFKAPQKIKLLENKNTALESKATGLQNELVTTKAQVTGLEAELEKSKTEINKLTTAMGEKITAPMAGLIAGVASLIGGLLTYFGVQSGIKQTDDPTSRKRKAMG